MLASAIPLSRSSSTHGVWVRVLLSFCQDGVSLFGLTSLEPLVDQSALELTHSRVPGLKVRATMLNPPFHLSSVWETLSLSALCQDPQQCTLAVFKGTVPSARLQHWWLSGWMNRLSVVRAPRGHEQSSPNVSSRGDVHAIT